MSRLVLLFPGGGTQYVGMGKRFLDSFQVARETFEEANDTLGYDLALLCAQGPLDRLSVMDHSQPGILTASVAAFRVFQKETGVTPAYLCGHSLGEYSALVCAEAIAFRDALRLVKRRGELLEQCGQKFKAGMMAVNKIEAGVIAEACEAVSGGVRDQVISVYNSPLQHVVSGTTQGLYMLRERLEASGAHCTILNINTPAHCHFMEDVSGAFREQLMRCTFGAFRYPVISNVTAQPYAGEAMIADLLTDHMVKPVRWYDSIRYIHDMGCTHAVDLGPQSVLKQLNGFIAAGMKSFSYELPGDVDMLRDAFDLKRIIRKCLVAGVSTRNYSDRSDDVYMDNVVRPYQRLQGLNNKAAPDVSEVQESIRIVAGILKAKEVSAAEGRRIMTTLQEEFCAITGVDVSIDF